MQDEALEIPERGIALVEPEEQEEGPRDDDDDDDVGGPSFFEEETQCKALLEQLATLLPVPTDGALSRNAHALLPSVGQDSAGAAAVVDHFTKIIDRYQESPHLLCPYLEGLVTPLVALLLRYLPSATSVWEYERRAVARDGAVQQQQRLMDDGSEASSPKQEPSTALGKNYDMFDADAPKTPIHLVCHTLYAIVKTAGEAACTSHFPNDVRHYEDVFYALRLWKNTEDDDQGIPGDTAPAGEKKEEESAAPISWARVRQREWEVRYCLLLWLCNLVLVPFSLHTIDSSATPAAAASEATASSAGRHPLKADALSDAVLVTAVQLLADTSKCRDGAALLVARLLTRPDSRRHRGAFFEFAQALVDATVAAGGTADKGSGAEAPEARHRHLNFLTEALAADAAAHPKQHAVYPCQGVFLMPGILSAMSMALKLGQRREMLPYAAGLIPGVAALLRLRTSDALLCKTAVKVVQRLVLAMLKNKSASWKYKRHDVASLAENLGAAGQAQAQGCDAAVVVGGATGDPSEEEEGEDGAVEGDPDALEEGVGLLLETLAHKDTIVRWSSASGVGRVCERLPADMALEVVEAVFECFASVHDDAAWHGGLLALAELCRRRVIHAAGLDKVVPIIARGLGFDLSKGTYSVGAHVRDAACYTCWSIARAYDAADLVKHVHTLSSALVVAALFDREVNVRRAAAAAFQECVGRLGTFPDGIALVTAMDFFSLASRTNAYLHVAPLVAQHDAYRGRMLDELVGTKLLHWDRNVRQCAAGALGRVAVVAYKRDPSGCVAVVAALFDALQRRVTDQTAATRHGAILGLAELVRGGLPVDFWSAAQRECLAEVVVRVDQARLFRSRGGEFIRHACCLLLSACATVRLPLPEFVVTVKMTGDKAKARTLGKWQEFLEETWKSILEWLQLAAAEAFAEVAAAFYTTFEPAFHGKMMRKMLDATAPVADASTAAGKATTGTALERRGFLAAMGGLPTCLLVAPQPPARAGVTGEEGAAAPFFLAVLHHLCAAALDRGTEPSTASAAADGVDSLPHQQPQQSVANGDAESRRNAVRSLARVLAAIPAGHPNLTPALYRRVLGDTLLMALQDYAVDKRGDVGSFVRIAVLRALPSVVAVGLRCRPGTDDSPSLLRTASQAEGEGEGETDCSARCLGVRVLQGCVKASLEKLDRVRGAAGAALDDLLGTDSAADASGTGITAETLCAAVATVSGSGEAPKDTVFLRSLLAALHATKQWEWTSPRRVIAALAPPLLLHSPNVYAAPAMEGLVVSAGDLSLHVQQPGMQALLSAFRGEGEEAGSSRAALRERLSDLLLTLGERHRHTERVLIPLSRVLDRLLSEGLLVESQHPRCVSLLRGELKHYATAITVVLPLVSLLATVCRSADDGARRDAWALALTMIASRYPKVRAHMATDLYTALLVFTSADVAERAPDIDLAGCQHAMDRLLKVQWDANDAAAVRSARDELYSLLGLAPPQKGPSADGKDAAAAAKPRRAAVASTYASLVQEAGY